MGKKGTKRRTRWKALPLAGEDGGSGNEDELQDDEQSTTSSGRIVLRMGERSYRSSRRYPYDRDRSKEPLVKLESKTFDEEEYTKITTPRQDVLFKKGYFAKRKNESSSDENNSNLNEEAEGEEGHMEQLIITNGFVDERGHYLVNGTSYEIYDPYTNTVTVMVGPPPYASGVTPPVLAALSCQPVPLQPVDWYPPGPGDWPPGPAWTPAYPPPTPKGPETGSSEGDSTTGSEEPVFATPPPFIFPSGMPIFPIPYAPNGVTEGDEEPESGSDTPSACPGSKPDSPVPHMMKTAGEEVGEVGPTEDEKPPSPKSSMHIENHQPPRPQLNPAGPEFVPRYPLHQNGLDFVPNQPLKPNGIVFVPRHHPHLALGPHPGNGVVHLPKQTINRAPQHRLSPTELPLEENATISKPQESQSKEETPNSPDKEVTLHASKEEIPLQTQLPLITPSDTGPDMKSLSEERQELPKIAQPVQTPDTNHKASHATQTSPDQKMQDDRQLPSTSASPRHSARKSTQIITVNNKQPAVIDVSKNSRRSYARTVISGLDQQEIVQNGVLNGSVPHDDEESHLGKDLNHSTNESPKEREHVVNGHVGKRLGTFNDSATNGLSDGKENKIRMLNGKGSNAKKFSGNNTTANGTTKILKPDKRTEKSERITNGNSRPDRLFEEDGDNFIQVESKRNNRAVHNGFAKNESKTKQLIKNQAVETYQDGFSSKKDKIKHIPSNRDNSFNNKTVSVTKASPKLGTTDKLEVEKTLIIPEERKEIVLPEKIESDKSSTISELSSPTELSSGQTTPPNKAADLKLEEKRADELNKSMEKLKENLEGESEERKVKKPKKVKKKAVKEEVKEPETYDAVEDLPLPAFLQPPQDELAHLDALLGGAATNAILRSLRVNEPSIAKVNLFPPRPTAFSCDIYTKKNLSNMRATRPEEFFASIVENPVPVEPLKVNEKPRKQSKAAERPETIRESPVVVLKPINTAYKPSKKREVKKEEENLKKTEEKSTEQRLGIVDAVKTWLESQEESDQGVVDIEEGETNLEPKNEVSNPLHASCPEKGGQEHNRCNRVAVDATGNDNVQERKTFFDSTRSLDESPKDKPAPELAALVDARTSVDKYYSLSPCGDSARQSVASETSEQEAIDALEYPFPRPASADVADPGPFPTKELACKLQ